MAKKPFDVRLFLILWAAGVVGVVALIPYSLSLQSSILEQLAELSIPLPALIVTQVIQNAILVAIAVGVGVLLAPRAGLGVPIISGWLAKENVEPRLRALLLPSILVGVVAGAVIILLDVVVFAPLLAGTLEGLENTVSNPPAWQGFLASFYGGITEELLLRFFLMTLLAWLLGLVWRREPGQPTVGAFWVANVVAAILFGAGHLPTAATLFPLTALMVVRVIALNSIGGIAFGHLYWTRGLEAAIIAHFSADIVLHVLTPLILG
ncbi:MAG: CPBP family intramembrane metalloprotease [Anaerolineae bacterium]|nr:CPBP family intramembrane metalloprotease [Anaerolineae bacterium]